MDNRWSLYKLHYVHLHSTLLKSPLPLLLPLSGLESPPPSYPHLSVPLQPKSVTPFAIPCPSQLHSLCTLHYTFPTLPLHPLHASKPPNTNPPSRTKRASPAHTSSVQKEKKREAQPHKATRHGNRKAAKFVRRTLFPLPLSASRADYRLLKRERER